MSAANEAIAAGLGLLHFVPYTEGVPPTRRTENIFVHLLYLFKLWLDLKFKPRTIETDIKLQEKVGLSKN